MRNLVIPKPPLTLELGPYASAIVRFQIRFPDVYPDLPPLVTFATDIFHPLIVPLTTYTFSTNSASDDPVSATDEERLPPGGFSLRHGFPHWFGRARRRSGVTSGKTSRNVSGDSTGAMSGSVKAAPKGPTVEGNLSDVQDSVIGSTSNPAESEKAETNDDTPPRVAQIPSADQFAEPKKFVPVAELLGYIRSTFDDEEVLDSLPSEAAANPGAWHAWKAHRRGSAGPGGLKRGSPQARLPGDWHWDGIWARRVQDEITASHSDPVLYGNPRGGSDDLVGPSNLGYPTNTDHDRYAFLGWTMQL